MNSTLKSARKSAGLTLEQLAERVGISVSQLSRFESGKREPRMAEMQTIADALGLSVADLLDKHGAHQAPLVGYVGAGAAMTIYSEGQGPFDYVDAPDGSTEKTVAAEIRGESLGALFDQWLVFYDDVHDPPASSLIGKLCLWGLADGRVLVKKLQRGQLKGHFNLISNTEPPIYDAAIVWAAKVKSMTPS
jgi:transcriptional regulator with XRE-family HTH domain